MSFLEKLKNDAEGIELLKDWLGEGGVPVDGVKADVRAYVCYKGNYGRPCVNNVEPKWWERVKNAVASVIKKQLEIKNRMELKAHREEKLFMCKACGCALPLKVHVPIQHIKDHTTDKQLKQMPTWCWIRTEINFPL